MYETTASNGIDKPLLLVNLVLRLGGLGLTGCMVALMGEVSGLSLDPYSRKSLP